MRIKIIIAIICIICQVEAVSAEYPPVEDNRTYYSIIYPSEHVKGDSYTITFVNEGEVATITHSDHISMGTYYQNATHKFFEYTILTGVIGGWKTFSWEIYDNLGEIIEIAYVDIHVLLDAYDESLLDQQMQTKDEQISDLREELGQVIEQNVTIEYVDRTITQMMSEWVEFERKETILIWLWFGSIPSVIGIYFMFRSLKLSKALQKSQNAIRVKTNFWDLTFEKLEDLVTIESEGVPASQLEVKSLFQKEPIVFASMFSNKLIDWLTCVPKSIKEKFKNVHFLDMRIEDRIERIRQWDKFSDISKRYDIWAQFIRTALIPACVMYREFWGDNIDPLVKLYNDYDDKAKQLTQPKRKDEEGEGTEVPDIISKATAYMQGGSYGTT